VCNHTSHDAKLLKEHPEWYYRDEKGDIIPSHWTDVVELDYIKNNPALWDYQIETFKLWTKLGVDGFRCDVASIVPIEFWKRARAELLEVNPNIIWLAESMYAPKHLYDRRRANLPVNTDVDLLAAFDIIYDNDLWNLWAKAIVSPDKYLQIYLNLLVYQDAVFPTNYIKMRYVENHDRKRFAAIIKKQNQIIAWTAFCAFNKGAFLIHGGQENCVEHTPSLFDKNTIKWVKNHPFEKILSQICRIKKHPYVVHGQFNILIGDGIYIAAVWQNTEGGLLGIFNVSTEVFMQVETILPDGVYEDILNEKTVQVKASKLVLTTPAIIVQFSGVVMFKILLPFYL